MKPNSVLLNRYLVQSELSHKAGRRTLLAKDTKAKATGQQDDLVIIKIIQFGLDFQWADLKLFEREAKILQNIEHSAIPKYKGYCEAEIEGVQSFVLVQTYIDAASLESAIQSGRTFSEEEIVEIANRLLSILSYLHERKPTIVHRDIKPSNILLGNRSGNNIGDLYLIDFGSVHTAAGKEEGTITIVGSYGYIPLEQFAGQAVPVSDLYSLGMTLIYLATGTHPAEMPQVHGKVQLSNRVSPKLGRWLERMTHPYGDQRFESAAIAISALNAGDDSYGYYHHLQPAGSTVKIQRERDRFVAFSDRPIVSNPGCSGGCLLVGLLIATATVISILAEADTNLIRGIVIGVSSLIYFQIARFLCSYWFYERHCPYNVVVVERHQDLRKGKCGKELSPVRWSGKPIPFEKITQLRYVPGYTFDHYYQEGKRVNSKVTVPPELSVYAGITEHKLVGGLDGLTQGEIWWLGKELGDFLGLDLLVIYPSPEIPKDDGGGGCGC